MSSRDNGKIRLYMEHQTSTTLYACVCKLYEQIILVDGRSPLMYEYEYELYEYEYEYSYLTSTRISYISLVYSYTNVCVLIVSHQNAPYRGIHQCVEMFGLLVYTGRYYYRIYRYNLTQHNIIIVLYSLAYSV